MTNQFPGLARGPIDHNASSVINSIAEAGIDMGSALILLSPTTPPGEILPRVLESSEDGQVAYGIAVGGDIDGIYGDGSASTDDRTRAAAAGDGVVVVTQGRCLARVSGVNVNGVSTPILIGDDLTVSDQGNGILVAAVVNADHVIARALQGVEGAAVDVIAVDVQREGRFA